MTGLPPTSDINAALNSTFTLKNVIGSEVSLKLIEVNTGRITENSQYEHLSMIFQCKEQLPQATYALNHDTLGKQELFVVPINEKEDNFEYEVIINRKTIE